jgi:hypothetical protein
MADVLIRDIPDEVVAAVDQRAARLGVSRTEYIRRRLAQDTEGLPVSVEDLRDFAAAFTDLTEPSVMGGAWD